MTEQTTRPRLDDADFAYIMSDDSMIGARIFPGDMVLVKEQSTVDNGDIALALMHGEVRIGRYSRHKDCELLTPASAVHNSIISDFSNPSFEIIAKAIAFIGTLSCGEEEANQEQT